MQSDEKKFLGSGLSFPLRTNARGEISLSSGSQDIEQAIGIILSTRPGERVMRPEFVCGAHDLLFEPRDASMFSLLQEYVLEALRMWEPRIQVLSVDVSLDPGSGGPENDFTNRNTTFMTWNLMHVARMIRDAGGIPAHGNQRSEWDAGCRSDFVNPEYR